MFSYLCIIIKNNNMKDIFEKAKFGDIFQTQDEIRAIYHYRHNNEHYLIIEGIFRNVRYDNEGRSCFNRTGVVSSNWADISMKLK